MSAQLRAATWGRPYNVNVGPASASGQSAGVGPRALNNVPTPVLSRS
jgi:hypothetical protein